MTAAAAAAVTPTATVTFVVVVAATTATGHLRRGLGALPSTPGIRRAPGDHLVPAAAATAIPGFHGGRTGPRPPRPAPARRGLPRGNSSARRRGKHRFCVSAVVAATTAAAAAAAGCLCSDGGRLAPAAAATAGAVTPGRAIR